MIRGHQANHVTIMIGNDVRDVIPAADLHRHPLGVNFLIHVPARLHVGDDLLLQFQVIRIRNADRRAVEEEVLFLQIHEEVVFLPVVFLQLIKAFMQILIPLKKLRTVHRVLVHRLQVLVVRQRPTRIVVDISEIVVDSVDV
ncbi:hypothetical protein D3C74_329810 [compost metagenome]